MLRFAPSPTGDMHIGNLRVALMNYIVAKQRGDGFILRIEDTDKERNIEGKEKEIEEILKKFAIVADQTFYQSEALGRHQKLAVDLVEKGKAFICICTPEELEADRERAKAQKRAYRYSGKCADMSREEIERVKSENIPFVIRIKKPQRDISFHDEIKGEITMKPDDIDSFVILRADGTPTYNFACACDDMTMGIDFVIRGEDHLSNTPKQIHIRESLGYDSEIKYAHLPIILNEDGKKMSKRDDASSVKWLLEQGFLPDAIINYLLLLGNKTPTEVFNLPEAIEWFDITAISKSPAKFDLNMLRHLNREHLSRMDDKELSKIFGFADAQIGKLAKLYLEEASTISELDSKIKAIFAPKECSGEWGEEMKKIASIIPNAPITKDFNEFKNYIIQETGLKGKRLFKPLRVLMSGAEHGPELSDLYPLISSYITEVAKCQQ